ncbi:8177_t:CDS:2 [Acaulospora morrowiae]|uniref:8177_t:CDS:1 n=1 Tax=Acaulospora morrowiae TaxID=94023 RepID=A0A9N9DYH0_9GLOM|nr:8177_t:CDS:2 [Acaulospora morrowiae]
MVLLVLTERIRIAVCQALQSPEFDESAKQRLKNYLKSSSCIPLDLIKEVSRFMVHQDGKLGRDVGNDSALFISSSFVIIAVVLPSSLGHNNHTDFIPVFSRQILVHVPRHIKDTPSYCSLSYQIFPFSLLLFAHSLSYGFSRYWLHELLTGSGVYVDPRKEKIKSPELIARLETILAEQANKEYARMIGRVASSYDVETFKILDTEEFQSFRGQLTAIVNITFTVVAVFAAVYHVAQNITGDTGMRVLLALAGSTIIGIAETFLYMRYLAGFDKPEQKERKVPRRKSTSNFRNKVSATHLPKKTRTL